MCPKFIEQPDQYVLCEYITRKNIYRQMYLQFLTYNKASVYTNFHGNALSKFLTYGSI